MSANSIANSLLLTSRDLTTPVGVVFDLWNRDETLAENLLAALLNKREPSELSGAAWKVGEDLFVHQCQEGTIIESFFQWSNKNGLNVPSFMAGAF